MSASQTLIHVDQSNNGEHPTQATPLAQRAREAAGSAIALAVIILLAGAALLSDLLSEASCIGRIPNENEDGFYFPVTVKYGT